MRGIHDDLHPIQGEIARKRSFGKGDVSSGGVIEALRAPKSRAGWAIPIDLLATNQRLDLRFFAVGQLETIRAEELDSIVLISVVRCADDDACASSHARRQMRDGRGWQGSAQ